MDSSSHDSFADNAGVKLEPIDEGDIKPCLLGKRERNFGSDPFSENEERDIRQKLDVGLSRSETMQRPGPGGSRLTYIEGWKVIHDANQIFGFNGWSSRVVTLDLRYLDESNHRFSACVCATVRITLRDGSYREDRGGGAADNMRSKGDALLKAEKEAVTDATKRALKNFGLRLGLSLYSREHVREMNRPQAKAVGMHANAGPSGNRTPQASRPAPGSGHRVPPPKGYGVSPVTPAAAVPSRAVGEAAGKGAGNMTPEAKRGQQFAAQRELALRRKQAFLQARAAEERTTAGIAGPNGSGRASNAAAGNGCAGGIIPRNTAAVIDGKPQAVGLAGSGVGNGFSGGGALAQGVGRAGSSSGGMGMGFTRNVGGGVGGVRGGVGGYAGEAAGVAHVGGNNGGGDVGRRQREIDELSRMAQMADF